MGIPITIPGLTSIIPEIPDGNVILIEGDINPIKSIFAQLLAGAAHNHGKEVFFITSRAEEEIKDQLQRYIGSSSFQIIKERSSHHWKNFIKKNNITIIDSFSYLILNKTLTEVQTIMEELDTICKQENAILLLTMEYGMLDEKVRVTASHIADGIFHFMQHDTKKGVAWFIRIPKWLNKTSFEQNIYYDFDGIRINVDLRTRVT